MHEGEREETISGRAFWSFAWSGVRDAIDDDDARLVALVLETTEGVLLAA